MVPAKPGINNPSLKLIPTASAADQAATLTPSETKSLAEYEIVIEGGLNDFLRVGTALTHIRDERLYRSEYVSFGDYCRKRWKMGRSYAYRLIAATKATPCEDRQEVSPIGDTSPAVRRKSLQSKA